MYILKKSLINIDLKLTGLFILVLFFGNNILFSQSSCANADFSYNNFTNWTGYTGSFINCCPTQGIVNGRHTIINTPGTDPRTGNQLQMLPPGGTRSAKLGNEQTGAQAERLTYTLTVTPQNALFIYKYAVVFQDPSHTSSDQPKFNIRVLNAQGNVLDPVCGFYSVVASGSIPGFQTAPGTIRWKDWTNVGIDLSSYMGQNITIEYTTYDCAQGGHYGYAYLSCSCAPMQISLGFCQGNSTVNMQAPDGFTSYLWSPGGQTTQNITVVNPVVGANYSCLLTSHNGCQVTLNTVLQPTIVNAAFNMNNPLCSNTITLNDNSAVNVGVIDEWIWTFGDGTTSSQQNPTHTYTSPGTYTVTLISGSMGCHSAPVTQTITIAPPPLANAGANASVCVGQTANLSASGGVSYLWSNNITTAQNNVTPLTTTTYTVTVSNTSGCTASDDVVVNVHPLPPANAGQDEAICSGDTTALNASGGVNYFWSTSYGLSSANTPNPNCFPLVSTHYIVTVVDANGCVNTDDVNISVLPLPTAFAGPSQSICTGDTATLTATGGVSYLWNTGQNQMQISVTPQNTTTYTVTVADANGCTASDDVTVVVNTPANISVSADTAVCNGQSVMLFANGGLSYQWSPPAGLSNTSIPNPIASPQVPTLYSVVASDANGCIAMDSVFVDIYPSPTISFNADVLSGCEPLTVHFTDNSTPAIQTWLWNFGDTGSQNNTSNIQNPTHEYLNAGIYDVSLSVVTYDGCSASFTQTGMIQVFPNPVVSYTSQPTVGVPGEPVTFLSSYTLPNATWYWNFGDGTNETYNLPTAQHTYSNMGNFIVQHTVETEHGCTTTVQNDFYVFTIKIPNIFTPNGDAYNDFFVIEGLEYMKNTHVIIFNRWGKKVFESYDYKNDWDGDNMADGVYYYIITFNEELFPSANGTVTILR